MKAWVSLLFFCWGLGCGIMAGYCVRVSATSNSRPDPIRFDTEDQKYEIRIWIEMVPKTRPMVVTR